MKLWLAVSLILVTLLMSILAAPAAAGPNAGGVLILAEAVGVDYTDSITDYCGLNDLTVCQSATTEAGLGETKVIHAIAAFAAAASPRLKGLAFGIGYDPGAVDFEGVVIVDYGKCAQLEVPTDGSSAPAWPDSGSGNALVFSTTQTAHLVEVYWFAAYGSSLAGGSYSLCLIPHPTQDTVFGDDDIPANLDEIAGLGCYGFGEPGWLPCKVYPPGACCDPNTGECTVTVEPDCDGDFDGSPSCSPNPCPQPGACCTGVGDQCVIRTAAECQASGWDYQGDGVPCDPNPCNPTPTFETTWGQIKATYR
jgi:hypothetical protein